MQQGGGTKSHTGGIYTRLPFAWFGGAVTLDFNNTVSWNRDGLREERLRTYGDLLEWAETVGLIQTRSALEHLAARRPRQARQVLEQARTLRGTLHAILSSRANGCPPPQSQIVKFNGFLRSSLARARLVAKGNVLAWAFRSAINLQAPLDGIVSEATVLLTAPQTDPVRTCANADCGWLFVDRSRKHNRRWCEMRVCGSRAKARRYYARQRAMPCASDGKTPG